MSKQQTLDDEFIKETAKVKCEICGREFEQITYSHLKTHGITFDEYIEQFPDALLASEGYRWRQRKAKIGKPKTELHKQHIRDNHPHLSGENAPNFGNHHTEESKQKMSDNSLHLSGEKNGMYGKKPWNYGETKETDDRVKNFGEKRKVFFQTEEGQQWLDEKLRGEKNGNYGKRGEETSMFGRIGEKSPTWNGGRAAAEERRRGFGFIPLNEKFPRSAAHHLDKELVLYIPKELHNSVYHNMHTGQGMEEINNLACEYVYGIEIGGE